LTEEGGGRGAGGGVTSSGIRVTVDKGRSSNEIHPMIQRRSVAQKRRGRRSKRKQKCNTRVVFLGCILAAQQCVCVCVWVWVCMCVCVFI